MCFKCLCIGNQFLLIKKYYKKLNDPFFIFWKAFTLFKENNANEAINELSSIQNKKEI